MLIWTDPLPEPEDPTDDGDGLWIWCEHCGGTGAIEHEAHEGMHDETPCPQCCGVGGRYEQLNTHKETR